MKIMYAGEPHEYITMYFTPTIQLESCSHP